MNTDRAKKTNSARQRIGSADLAILKSLVNERKAWDQPAYGSNELNQFIKDIQNRFTPALSNIVESRALDLMFPEHRKKSTIRQSRAKVRTPEEVLAKELRKREKEELENTRKRKRLTKTDVVIGEETLQQPSFQTHAFAPNASAIISSSGSSLSSQAPRPVLADIYNLNSPQIVLVPSHSDDSKHVGARRMHTSAESAKNMKNGIPGLKKSKKTYIESVKVRLERIMDRCNAITLMKRQSELSQATPVEKPLRPEPLAVPIPVLGNTVSCNPSSAIIRHDNTTSISSLQQAPDHPLESIALQQCTLECQRLEELLIQQLLKRRNLLIEEQLLSSTDADQASFSGVMYCGPFMAPVIFRAGQTHMANLKMESIYLSQHADSATFRQDYRKYMYKISDGVSGLGHHAHHEASVFLDGDEGEHDDEDMEEL